VLLGGCDTAIRVAKEEDHTVLSVEKQKDGEELEDIHFTMEVVDLTSGLGKEQSTLVPVLSAGATATTSANDSATVLIDGLASLKQELSDLRDEQRIASATIASGTSKTARILERVTPDGDALAVRTAA